MNNEKGKNYREVIKRKKTDICSGRWLTNSLENFRGEYWKCGKNVKQLPAPKIVREVQQNVSTCILFLVLGKVLKTEVPDNVQIYFWYLGVKKKCYLQEQETNFLKS